jgi:hypothetical protein
LVVISNAFVRACMHDPPVFVLITEKGRKTPTSIRRPTYSPLGEPEEYESYDTYQSDLTPFANANSRKKANSRAKDDDDEYVLSPPPSPCVPRKKSKGTFTLFFCSFAERTRMTLHCSNHGVSPFFP